MATDVVADEQTREAQLVQAEANACELFDAVVERELLTPGVGEREASDAVRDLAAELFGVSRWWHKRIVRAGPNTLAPYRENPPDRAIEADDIVFLDFGPIFEQWEADFGRTYVLGDDPRKHALRDVMTTLWNAGRDVFAGTPDITGAQLYDRVRELTIDAGWEYGSAIAGHLVGEFPHEKIAGKGVPEYIMRGSDEPMRRLDRTGRVCHWILELHVVDRDRGYGGFFEQLLDIGPNA